jgi:hypothetical protein
MVEIGRWAREKVNRVREGCLEAVDVGKLRGKAKERREGWHGT